METAITFVNNKQVSIVSSLDELLKEINHYKAFWLFNHHFYTNIKNVVIRVENLTDEDRLYLSSRMKGQY